MFLRYIYYDEKQIGNINIILNSNIGMNFVPFKKIKMLDKY